MSKNGESSELPAAKRSRTSDKNRSDMWEHFQEVKSNNGTKYAKCKHCPQVQCYDKPINPDDGREKGLYKKDGTGNMMQHMLKMHPNILPPPKLPGQMQLSFTSASSPGPAAYVVGYMIFMNKMKSSDWLTGYIFSVQ